ncbi:aegerolysin family protein [Meridianimarinicoccus sp. RP-17]|uniref:aegerolysin family protein n=1 Tax=Meridianimarinicoccus zhengii TaxID=2056810 RepID=UPI000DAEF7C2|nr:aegerolysin family protein [Phycocomes zhengii]
MTEVSPQAAYQHLYVAAKNHTPRRFVEQERNVEHGVVEQVHPIEKRSTTTTVFFARGSNNAVVGAVGSIRFVDAEDHSTGMTIEWAVPWGSKKSSFTVTGFGDIDVEPRSLSGKEVTRKVVEIRITDHNVPSS